MTLHRERHGKPSRDTHLLQPGELATLLTNLTVRRFEEGWHDDCHTGRLWGLLET